MRIGVSFSSRRRPWRGLPDRGHVSRAVEADRRAKRVAAFLVWEIRGFESLSRRVVGEAKTVSTGPREDMELAALLRENRGAILERWFERIIDTYPDVASAFLAKQKDRFRNPVGYAITQSIGPIYDEIASTMDQDRLLEALDGIIRIRSVQDFTPTETIGFVFELKAVIRAEIGDRTREHASWNDLTELDSRVDRVALLAFEKYTECREDLHRVRRGEIERRAAGVLGRLKVGSAISGHEEEPIDDDV